MLYIYIYISRYFFIFYFDGHLFFFLYFIEKIKSCVVQKKKIYIKKEKNNSIWGVRYSCCISSQYNCIFFLNYRVTFFTNAWLFIFFKK